MFSLYSARSWDVLVRREDVERRGRRGQAVGPCLREETRDEIRAIRGQLEERLVHQLQSRLPRRMSMMNTIDGFSAAMYVKFCSGPTPMYDAAGPRRLEEVRNDPLHAELVRQQVVGAECAVRLGRIRAEFPEFLIVRRAGAAARKHAAREKHAEHTSRYRGTGEEKDAVSGHAAAPNHEL